MKTAEEFLREAHRKLSEPNPADWNQFDEIMKDEQGPAMIKAMKAYAEQFIDAAAQYGDLLFEQNQTRIRGKDKASKYAQECVASWIVGYKSKIIKLKEHLK